MRDNVEDVSGVKQWKAGDTRKMVLKVFGDGTFMRHYPGGDGYYYIRLYETLLEAAKANKGTRYRVDILKLDRETKTVEVVLEGGDPVFRRGGDLTSVTIEVVEKKP